MRGAWIEIGLHSQGAERFRSLPVRGAWIEIVWVYGTCPMRKVAPRAGSVD